MKGKPSKATEWLSEDNLLRIKGWARDGLTDKDIAEKKIGISERTFVDWKKKYPDTITASLKEGRQPVDTEIEDSMVKSAKGFYVYEKKPIKVKTTKKKDGMEITEEHVEVVEVKRYVEPVVVAQIFWLKNRKPDYWKDKRETVDTNAIDKLDRILDGIEANAKTE